MKIDFVINSLGGGGAERVMSTLVNGFSEENQVSLITFNEGMAYSISSNVEIVRLHQGRIKNHTIRSFINLSRRYLNKHTRPNLIISFLPANALITIPIGLLFGIKVIVSEHSNHLANPERKKKLIRKVLYRFASAVTVLTTYDFDYFKNLSKKVVIMPNPLLNPAHISLFSERKKNILAAGSLTRYQDKGFDSLLRITAPLLKEHKEWTITIAGGGDKGKNDLINLSKELNIEQQVILPGFCDNIQELMQNSQIFALPSKFEGLPMVLMEALSNGMACIAYDCVSGPRELIEDKVNGLLIKDQDSIAFQRGLYELVTHDQLRRSLADNGPESMRPYQLSQIIDRWKKLIQEITDNQ